SRGDDELLRVHGAIAEHFPQNELGWYCGYHPASSEQALEQLKRMAAAGAEYLAFPQSAFWWLDFYSEFRDYLETRCHRIPAEESCRIYDVRKCATPAERSSASQSDSDCSIAQVKNSGIAQCAS